MCFMTNSKPQFVKELKKMSCDKTQKLGLWQNSKTKILKNSKTQVVTKLKDSNLDKNQKLKLW